MNKRLSFKALGRLLRDSIKGFSADKVTKQVACHIFQWRRYDCSHILWFQRGYPGGKSPVIISFCGFFFGQETVTGKIYAQLESFLSHDTAIQIEQIIK